MTNPGKKGLFSDSAAAAISYGLVNMNFIRYGKYCGMKEDIFCNSLIA